MSWIKVRTNLRDDPRVIAIASALGVHRDTVLGKLVVFWGWADQHTENGNALSVTFCVLNEITSCPNFAENLKKVGWLTGEDGNLSIPHFEEHNGQSSKRRAVTAKRVGIYRKTKCNDLCNADSVTPSSSYSMFISKEGSAEGNPAETPKEKRIPTVEEWIAYGRLKDPLWPTSEIRSGWVYYESIGWKRKGTPISKWRMCVETCYAHWKRNNRIP